MAAVGHRGAGSAASSARALTGVLVREVVNFSSYWRSSTFSSTVEPTIYLLAFGFGFGSLVSTVGGYDYVEFVATGIVATAVLFSSAFPAMFGTFVKYQFQHTYDAILAAPVDTEELVTAEALWMRHARRRLRLRAADRRDVLRPRPVVGDAHVPFIAFVSGYGWACFGIAVAGFANSIDNFSYIVSAVLTPLFLVAGTFFPMIGCPSGRRSSAISTRCTSASCSSATPSFGFEGWSRPAAPRVSRRLRPGHVATRDPRDDAQARRLAMPTVDDVRSVAAGLPRSTEAFVRGRVKFRVGRIVYLAFSRDETELGFAFPKEWRDALVEQDPDKFRLPDESDLRYNWAVVRMAAIDATELRELVVDAWAFVVPKRVAAEYARREEERCTA